MMVTTKIDPEVTKKMPNLTFSARVITIQPRRASCTMAPLVENACNRRDGSR
jgi:hypothetical protein